MAPEQVKGKDADARSDTFALGTVLYEMAASKRAFEGETARAKWPVVLERAPAPISRPAEATEPLTLVVNWPTLLKKQ